MAGNVKSPGGYCTSLPHTYSCVENCTQDAASLHFEDLLHTYGVDVMFTGHSHQYERTTPVYRYQNQSASSDSFLNPAHTVFVNTGSAGNMEVESGWMEPRPPWSVGLRGGPLQFGFAEVRAEGRERLSFIYRESSTGDILDRFEIRRTGPHPSLAKLAGNAAAEGWAVGAADSTTNVLRSDSLPPPPPQDGDHGDATAACLKAGLVAPLATVALAQAEFEAVQLVVRTSPHNAASGIRWKLGETVQLGGANAQQESSIKAEAFPIGFVHRGSFGSWDNKCCPFNTTSEKCPKPSLSIDCGDGTCVHHGAQCLGCSHVGSPVTTDVNHWPYVALDFIDSFDVAANTSQPILLRFQTSATSPPGLHVIPVTLTDASGATTTVHIAVKVWKFELPSTPSLPTIWGLDDHRNGGLWAAKAETSEFQDRFVDFFASHRIPVTSLYDGQLYGFKDTPSATSPSGLRSLWDKGQRVISVGGVLASDNPTPEEMASFLNATVQGVAAAELAGIAKSNMIVVR